MYQRCFHILYLNYSQKIIIGMIILIMEIISHSMNIGYINKDYL